MKTLYAVKPCWLAQLGSLLFQGNSLISRKTEEFCADSEFLVNSIFLKNNYAILKASEHETHVQKG